MNDPTQYSPFADFVADLPMEISSHFYPLPSVANTSCNFTYPLDEIEQEYDYTVENAAIGVYHKWLKDVEAEQQLRAKRKSEAALKSNDYSRSRPDNPSAAVNGTNKNEPTQPVHPTFSLLQPVKADPPTQPIPSHTTRSSSDIFDVFAPTNPFDSLQMKTLNDKQLLAQILQ